MSIDEQLLHFIHVNLPQTLWFLTTFMYVHRRWIRGQDSTSDFKTIQSDERWTLRAPSLKQAWLRNQFSVIYPWCQIKPFLTCVIIEGKWRRGHLSTIHRFTNLCSTTLPLALWYYVKYRGCRVGVREGMKPTLTGQTFITRLAQTHICG